jgi:protein SCO1/2
MTSKHLLSRRQITGVFLAGALAATLTAVGGCGSSNTPAASPVKVIGDSATSGLHGDELATPLHAPDVALTDTSGKPFNLATATTSPLTLVFFGYTHCPDDCPTTMADVAAGLHKLPPAQQKQIKVVFITTDPWRDTSQRLRQWLNNFDHAFIGLTGQYAKIQSAARSLGVDAEKPKTMTGNYEVTHGNNLLVFRPDHQARVVYVAGVSNTHLSDDLAVDLPKLLHDRT